MRPRGQTPRMPPVRHPSPPHRVASMRPRGQTPRMPVNWLINPLTFGLASMRPRGQTPRMHRITPRHGPVSSASMRPRGQTPRMPRSPPLGYADATLCFNEAAGTDPADAPSPGGGGCGGSRASMRPRGQTPRMQRHTRPVPLGARASMRPRGQTPRMRGDVALVGDRDVVLQ